MGGFKIRLNFKDAAMAQPERWPKLCGVTHLRDAPLNVNGGIIFGEVKWSVSGRHRANGSVRCNIKRPSELLILL